MANPNETMRAAGRETPCPGRWEALMAAAQDGDKASYAVLLREIQPLLRAVARRRFREPADVEDVVQETLMTVHALRHVYDPARPIRTWLTALCQRRSIDAYRRTLRHRARMTGLTEEHEALAAPSSGGGEASIAAGELRAMVLTLPAAQRAAITLTKLQGLSLAEASARVGASVSALKVACSRGIRALRERTT